MCGCVCACVRVILRVYIERKRVEGGREQMKGGRNRECREGEGKEAEIQTDNVGREKGRRQR